MAAPLKTCSLLVEQHGDTLHLNFQHLQNPDDPSSLTLFAQAKIDLKKGDKMLSMEYFVESVVDSSRYFVVRIIDEKSGREARIGFGFRDREEATDFRESLQYYARSLKRQEEAAEAMHHADDLAKELNLQEGEKIHINLGSKGGAKSTISKAKPKSDGATPKKPMLLKKPPPAASPGMNKDVSISFGDMHIGDDGSSKHEDASSAAVGDLSRGDFDIEDDDEWGDFEDAEGSKDKLDAQAD